jgi:hypothetical protein
LGIPPVSKEEKVEAVEDDIEEKSPWDKKLSFKPVFTHDSTVSKNRKDNSLVIMRRWVRVLPDKETSERKKENKVNNIQTREELVGSQGW